MFDKKISSIAYRVLRLEVDYSLMMTVYLISFEFEVLQKKASSLYCCIMMK